MIVVRGGIVVDPANGIEEPRDLWIRDGRVAAVAAPGDVLEPAATVVDAAGCWVVPGLIDMHVHLREPGFEYRETIATGARAAVVGGFTAVACMANTDPVNDNAAVTALIVKRGREAQLARVFPIGAVSKGLRGEELAEFGEMHRAGIVAVSDDGKPIMDGGLMRRALEYSGMFGLVLIAHEEDCNIAAGGVMHEGETSLRLGLRGMPAAAEDAMIARDIAILERTQGRLHIAHISTAGGVHLVREAKARGLAVTAEAAPHHFTLCDEAVARYDTNAKMKPPLRGRRDVEAVIAGLVDGTIDAIATDHAPHHRDEKDVEFDKANDGIVGLETALPLSLRLWREHGLTRSRLIAALTCNPARILGLELGSLAVGTVADVTVLDPDARWVCDPEALQSKSHNTPFGGTELQGQAVTTIVDGRVVWSRPSAGESGTLTTERKNES